MERPFFFEVDGQRLFGMAHEPAERAPRVAVVVCHPYGEEKQLSAPVLVRGARALAARGIGVLRFDCRGYGDSDGDLEGATVSSQVDDTLAAGRVARERLAVPAVVYLGLRLGAAIAALAAERDPTTAGVVLWSPVVDGARYLDEMIRKRLFAAMLAGQRTTREEILAQLASDGMLDIEGNGLTPPMAAELATVDLRATAARLGCPVLATAIRTTGKAGPAADDFAGGYQSAGDRAFWERGAMYDQYQPDDLFELTSGWLAARWGSA